MKEHEIIIPHTTPKLLRLSNSFLITLDYSKCLNILPVFYDNVSVICDNDLLTEKTSSILAGAPHIDNRNNSLCNLFMVNDHIFVVITCDTPVENADVWVPYYAQYIAGFFVLCHRHSTAYIFDDCGIPVFPLFVKPDPHVPMVSFEHNAHATSMAIPKDISVFFQGRYETRLPRKLMAEQIRCHIADTRIGGNRGDLSGAEYIDLMCRSKIAWCPRSVRSPPDHECNAITARESEAMCLECLVVRPSIGITEVEKRAAGVHYVEIQNDSSDLIEKLQYYLEHEDERKEIAHNGRLWWERNGSVTARAKRIFSDCLRAIKLEEQ